MTDFGESRGKFFAGSIADFAPRMANDSVKLAYVTLSSPRRVSALKPPPQQFTLPHLDFETLPARCRQRQEFVDFLALHRNTVSVVQTLLRDSGVLLLRVDAFLGAYARLLGDEIFGEDGLVNEIPLRPSDAALRYGHFVSGIGRNETVLVFAKERARYRWLQLDPRASIRSQFPDVVEHATETGDLVLTVDELYPRGGVTARAIACGRRVVVVHHDRDVLSDAQNASIGTKNFSMWAGEAEAS